MESVSVREYLEQPESLYPTELVHGIVVREPAMPAYGHQLVATRLTARLLAHVEERALGICLQPIDVVLDEPAALVVQPDIIVVTNERRGIVRDRIWGAPDLVVEILSPKTARWDRTTKLGWYRQYGVRECWLVSYGLQSRAVEVVDLQSVTVPQLFTAGARIRSHVLPDLQLAADDIFA